jgi:hypothetical protein
MKPTIYHGPLPRMRRQPTKLSVMIHQRRQSRARRAERAQEISELRRDVNAESRFEHSLGRDVRESVWKGPAASEWRKIHVSLAMTVHAQRSISGYSEGRERRSERSVLR